MLSLFSQTIGLIIWITVHVKTFFVKYRRLRSVSNASLHWIIIYRETSESSAWQKPPPPQKLRRYSNLQQACCKEDNTLFSNTHLINALKPGWVIKLKSCQDNSFSRVQTTAQQRLKWNRRVACWTGDWWRQRSWGEERKLDCRFLAAKQIYTAIKWTEHFNGT